MKLTLINTGLSDSSYMVKDSCDNLKENPSASLRSKKQYMLSAASGGFGVIYSCGAIYAQSSDRVIWNTTLAALLFFYAIWKLPSGSLGSSINALEEQAEIQPQVWDEAPSTTAAQTITNRVVLPPPTVSTEMENSVFTGSELLFEDENGDESTLECANRLWAIPSTGNRKSVRSTKGKTCIEGHSLPLQIRALNKEKLPPQIKEPDEKIYTNSRSKKNQSLVTPEWILASIERKRSLRSYVSSLDRIHVSNLKLKRILMSKVSNPQESYVPSLLSRNNESSLARPLKKRKLNPDSEW